MAELVLDGITSREFAADELTALMNVVPNSYDLVTRLGIFGEAAPIATTYVAIDIQGYTLNLLPITERGGPASKGSVGKRARKIFEVPQVAHEDHITVADVQNLQRFGSKAPMMLEDLMGQKLFTMARKHYLTHEWHKVQMLQGKLVDSDGTVVLNMFTEFDVVELAVPFGGASSVNQYIRNVKRHIEDNLLGETMTGIACLASGEFMDMLLEDADIKSAYNAASAAYAVAIAANPNLSDLRFSFQHQGVTFVEYRGRAGAKNADGSITTRNFIPAGDARFFPIGTMDSAKLFAAPGDFEESVNMPGQVFYAKEARDKWGRARDIHTQSNVLPLWTRPALLVRGHTGSS